MISRSSVLGSGEVRRGETGNSGRGQLNDYFAETPGDKPKVKEKRRKIQFEATLTLKVVPATMRAWHIYALWKAKINQWEWTGDTEKTQHAAAIGRDCTISGGEERVKKADVRPAFKSSHSKPSKQRLLRTIRHVAGAIKPLPHTFLFKMQRVIDCALAFLSSHSCIIATLLFQIAWGESTCTEEC